ncbi:MAG: hypothetical protein II379_05615, partial [Oscillospiraceae bacterium]|nr:hypothetical protein [Oscillospiraceae bacterium]
MKNVIRSLRRTAVALLAVLCFLPVANSHAASDYYRDTTHADVDYSEMPRTGIDLAEVDAALSRFAADPE